MRLRQQGIQLASLQEKMEQYEQLVHDCTQQMQAKDEQLVHLKAEHEKQAKLLADAQYMLQVKEQALADMAKIKAIESPTSRRSECTERDFVSRADHEKALAAVCAKAEETMSGMLKSFNAESLNNLKLQLQLATK